MEANLAGGFDAVDVGHPQIHDEHVRADLSGQCDGGAAIVGLADDGDAFLGETFDELVAQGRVVIDDHHPERFTQLDHVPSCRPRHSQFHVLLSDPGCW